MLAMAALAGPQRMSLLHRADVVDAEKLFGASGGVTALRVGPHGGSRLRGFGLHASFAKAAPQWFRVAALSEVLDSAFSLSFFRFTV